MRMKKTGYVFVFLFNYFHITKTSFHDKNKLARQQKSQIICLMVISVVKYHLKCLQHRNVWVQKRRITNLILAKWPTLTPGIPNTGWGVNKGLVFVHSGGSATKTHFVWRYSWQVCVLFCRLKTNKRYFLYSTHSGRIWMLLQQSGYRASRAFRKKNDVSKNKNYIAKNVQQYIHIPKMNYRQGSVGARM